MLRFLLAVAGGEIRYVVRRTAITATLMVFAALLLVGTVLALGLALFIVLAEYFDPAVAALILAGINLLGALILFFIARARGKRRARPVAYPALSGLAPPPPPVAAAAPGGVPVERPLPGGSSTVIALAAGAALLGLILGRRL